MSDSKDAYHHHMNTPVFNGVGSGYMPSTGVCATQVSLTSICDEHSEKILELKIKVVSLETQVSELTQVVETLQEMMTELIERSERPKAKTKGGNIALQEEVEKMLRARAEIEKFADEQREAKRQSLLSEFQGMGITDPEKLISK